MSVTFKLEGGQQMLATLNGLAREYGPRNARTAFNTTLRNSMRIVEEDIRRNTPRDEGDLVNSVGLTTRIRDVRRARKQLAPGVRNRDIFAVASAGWLRPGGRNWNRKHVAVEYGTRRQRPQRVIRGALERNSQAVINSVSSGWKQSLEKRRSYLSRRNARGKLKIR